MGKKGGGVIHSQPRNGVDGNSRHYCTQRRYFQESEGRVLGSEGRDFQAAKQGCQKGLGACAFMYILCK
jgi:hypothetical protein